MYKFRSYEEYLDIPLYKYYGNYEYVKDCIENKRLYLSLPENFNDIYDSTFAISKKDLKFTRANEDYFDVIKYYLNREDKDKLTDDYKANFNSCKNLGEAIELLKKLNIKINIKAFNKNISKVLNKPRRADNNKVVCFSENPDSILMWSYYADKHQGVCLKFDFSQDETIKKNCHKVVYSDLYNPSAKPFKIYFTKSRQWEHEQEWRIVCETDQDYLPFKGKVSIILGKNISIDDFQDYYDLAFDNHLDLYKVVMENKSYKLKLKKILNKGKLARSSIKSWSEIWSKKYGL